MLGLLHNIVSERRKNWRKVLGLIVLKAFSNNYRFRKLPNVEKGDAFYRISFSNPSGPVRLCAGPQQTDLRTAGLPVGEVVK